MEPSYEAINLDVHIRAGAKHGPTNTIMKFNPIALMTLTKEFLYFINSLCTKKHEAILANSQKKWQAPMPKLYKQKSVFICCNEVFKRKRHN